MSEPVEGSAFRSVMRRVPAPVVVVTARGETEARGITIGSFTSVALDPPLVSFNVGQESRMHGIMETCSAFAVHVLSEQQVHLAKRFATPGLTADEQFEALSYHTRAGSDLPLLNDVTARLLCTPEDSIVAGDHTLYVGQVVEIEEPPDAGAVLYYQSSYRGVGSELPSMELSPVKRASSESS